MSYRTLVFGMTLIVSRTMVISSSLENTFRRSSDPIVKALASYGYHIELPSNSNYTCLYSNNSDCNRLEFQIEFHASHALSARLFVYQDSMSLRNVSLLWPPPSSEQEHTRVEDDWMYFETTHCLQRVRKNTFHCSIEYAGDGEVFRGREEQLLPFLVVSSGIRSRRRRTTPSCTLQDRFVNSRDLGKGEALPLRINLRTCAGECPVNVGIFKNDYARAMYLSHKRKRLHIPDESWKPSCQITGMEPIHLFFKNVTSGNVTLYETKVDNLVVTSCGCRVHMCSAP